MTDDHTMLGRALAVLDACVSGGSVHTLAELTRQTGLPKPTVRRIAGDLVARELLERIDGGYRAGPRLALLGDHAAAQRAPRACMTAHLTELHRRTRGAVWIADVTSDTYWHLTASIYDHSMPSALRSGRWLTSPPNPATLCSAIGILAMANRLDQAEALFRAGVPRLTPQSVVAPRAITSRLRRAVDDGVVVEHEQLVRGWSCVAVPITDHTTGALQAVLGVVDRTHKFRVTTTTAAALRTAETLKRSQTATPNAHS